MDSNFNPNGENQNENERPSDSLYSYSYIKKEEPNVEQSTAQNAGQSNTQNTSQNSGEQSVAQTQSVKQSTAQEPVQNVTQSTAPNTYQGSTQYTSQSAAQYTGQSAAQDAGQSNTQSTAQYTGQSTSQNAYQGSTQNTAPNAGQNMAAGSTVYRQSYMPNNVPQKKAHKEKKKGGFGKMLGKCAAIALVFGLISGTVFHGTGMIFDYASGKNGSTQGASAQQGNNGSSSEGNKVTATSTGVTAVVSDISDVVEEVMPAIVSITNLSVQQYQNWFGQTYTQEGTSAGSGIIVAQTDDMLYIATNNHVVEGATSLSVTFVDEQTVAAEIKGVDSSTDLAVIEIPISNISADTLSEIKVATLGNSDNLRMGEPAIAIGNALGYGQSVTTGVISALNREVSVTDSSNNTITNSLIQTSAAINPGNSGGALLNISGEVIGINEVKYSDTDVEGMGFAIPMATAEPIINDLITREAVKESEAAFLGVYGQNVTESVSEAYNMPVGIYVAKVTSGSAAEKAGIRLGDIITDFDGRTVETMEALQERLQYYKAGTTVDITLQRVEGGQWVETVISVTLGKKN